MVLLLQDINLLHTYVITYTVCIAICTLQMFQSKNTINFWSCVIKPFMIHLTFFQWYKVSTMYSHCTCCKEFLSEYSLITSVSQYLHLPLGRSCKHSQAVKHISPATQVLLFLQVFFMKTQNLHQAKHSKIMDNVLVGSFDRYLGTIEWVLWWTLLEYKINITTQ